MSGAAVMESGTVDTSVAVAALGVFDVLGRGAVRAAILEDGALVRVSAIDAMAVWPMQYVTMLVIEEYALSPADMQLRVHTSCGQVLRLRGEVSNGALLELLRLESTLTLG